MKDKFGRPLPKLDTSRGAIARLNEQTKLYSRLNKVGFDSLEGRAIRRALNTSYGKL